MVNFCLSLPMLRNVSCYHIQINSSFFFLFSNIKSFLPLDYAEVSVAEMIVDLQKISMKL